MGGTAFQKELRREHEEGCRENLDYLRSRLMDALIGVAVTGENYMDQVVQMKAEGMHVRSSEALDEVLAQALPVIQRLHFKEFDA